MTPLALCGHKRPNPHEGSNKFPRQWQLLPGAQCNGRGRRATPTVEATFHQNVRAEQRHRPSGGGVPRTSKGGRVRCTRGLGRTPCNGAGSHATLSGGGGRQLDPILGTAHQLISGACCGGGCGDRCPSTSTPTPGRVMGDTLLLLCPQCTPVLCFLLHQIGLWWSRYHLSSGSNLCSLYCCS